MDQNPLHSDTAARNIDWARDRNIPYQLERLRKLKSALCTERLVLNEYKTVLDNYADVNDVDNTALLEMWLDYIKLIKKTGADQNSIISIFEKLKLNRISHHRAKLYLCWAETLAERGQVSKACLVLQAALGSKVEPADELREYLAKISPRPGSHSNPDAFNQLKNHMINGLVDSKSHLIPAEKQQTNSDISNATPLRRVFNFGRLNIGSPPARVAPDCDHHSERVPIFAHPSPPEATHKAASPIPAELSPQKENSLKRHLDSYGEENNNSEIPNYSKREQRNPALVQTSSFPTEVVDSELDCMSKDDPLINGALRSRVKDMPEDMVCDKDKYDTPIVTARPKIPSKSPAMLSSPDSSGNDAMPLSNAYSQSLPHQRSDKVMKINNRIYKRLELIGRGGSSKVFKIISQDGRKFLALKRVSLRGADSAAIKGYLSEIDFLKRLRKNSRIITLIDYQVSLSDGLIHMVLEYGEIDLARLCHKYRNSPMSLNSIRMYWEQMLNAVHTIHQENIIHSDLKPANFLLVEGALKLIDFGIARSIPNDTTNVHRDYQTGTINYMAPEAISFIEKNSSSSDRKSYIKLGRASDVWSLGCILYQMVYGQPPFAYLDTIIKKLQCIVDPNYQIAFPQSILVETPPPSSSQDAKGAAGASNISNKVTIRVDPSIISAIKGCLVRVPQDRMSIPQLLEHELLVPKTSTPPSEERPSSSTLAETLSKDTKLLNVIAREIIVTSVERLQANVFPSALLAMSDDIARVISSQLENGERVDLGKFRNTTYTPP